MSALSRLLYARQQIFPVVKKDADRVRSFSLKIIKICTR
jgi:hypothetical protein